MSRFKCHSDLYDMELMLDVNVSIYPLKVLLHSAPAPASSIITLHTHSIAVGCCRSGTSSAWRLLPPSIWTMPPQTAPIMRHVPCSLASYLLMQCCMHASQHVEEVFCRNGCHLQSNLVCKVFCLCRAPGAEA